MESQNIERRDSKKSNKGGGSKSQGRGGGGGSGANNGGNTGGGGKPSGEKHRSNSQKSGKPYREIYKPPSLRSSKNRNSNSSSEGQQSSKSEDNPGGNYQSKKNNSSNPSSKNNGSHNNGQSKNSPSFASSQQNGSHNNSNTETGSNNEASQGYSLFGSGSNGNGNSGNSSVPSSPLLSSRMQNSFNFGLAQRMFNVNAKEFQFLPLQQQQQQQQQQHQQQQLSNFLSQFDPSLLYNANAPLLPGAGCYPLKQSKSSGNMNLLLQHHQQQQQQQQQVQAQAQAVALQQLQNAVFGFSPLQAGNLAGAAAAAASMNGGAGQFNRLSQSKSSGNVPGNGKPRVRFDDEELDQDDYEDLFMGDQLGNYLASLKLNGDLTGFTPNPNISSRFPFQPQHQQQQQSKSSKLPTLSPQPVLKSSLQKSRTGFYLNLYGNQQQQQQQQPMQIGSPTKSLYGFSNAMGNNNNNLHSTGPAYLSKFGQQQQSSTGMIGSAGTGGVVKRSRSFGPGNHHVPRVSATTLLSATHGRVSSSSSSGSSIYSDFCITKWPRDVQELVTAAVTGVERIPARNWIEMVNGIFDAMLYDYRPSKSDKSTGRTTSSSPSASSSAGENNDKILKEAVSPADNDDEDEDEDETDLTSAAVHIFLYFIQREKDRTVMESLLNTCFASFQRLSRCSVAGAGGGGGSKLSGKSQKQGSLMSSSSAPQIEKPSISRQWCNFLRFLSTLYSQVKLIRRQKQSQQQPGQSMDEMSVSLLALLCDSCLSTLRSPQSYTAEMMGCLFTVLTSIGRDMEGTFPLKMKQLLAAVRDALLGIGPYHTSSSQQGSSSTKTTAGNNSKSSSSSTSSSLSPIVQKTLMQLIELHAANWQLPASAVRYYYSSVSSGAGGAGTTTASNNINNNNNNSSSAGGSGGAAAANAKSTTTTTTTNSTNSNNNNNNNSNNFSSPANNEAQKIDKDNLNQSSTSNTMTMTSPESSSSAAAAASLNVNGSNDDVVDKNNDSSTAVSPSNPNTSQVRGGDTAVAAVGGEINDCSPDSTETEAADADAKDKE